MGSSFIGSSGCNQSPGTPSVKETIKTNSDGFCCCMTFIFCYCTVIENFIKLLSFSTRHISNMQIHSGINTAECLNKLLHSTNTMLHNIPRSKHTLGDKAFLESFETNFKIILFTLGFKYRHQRSSFCMCQQECLSDRYGALQNVFCCVVFGCCSFKMLEICQIIDLPLMVKI